MGMNKRRRARVESAVVDVWKREVGELSTRNFAHRLAASEDLVLRLDIFGKLENHRGCVNTVSFNADGSILVSGSDDRRVILWDWESGKVRLSFHSGHQNNVFQAKIMPYTEDRSIVTCAADGQVRHAQMLERGKVETELLTNHNGRAHKLAVEPGSPHIFYTCGEDGLVQHIDLRTGVATELFTCQPIKGRRLPVVHLNTIAINPRNPNLFSVAGADEFARLFDIRKYKWDGSTHFGQPVDFFCPTHLLGDEHVGITGLAFSDQNELLVSYNDEFIYLFSKDMGLGPQPEPPSPVSSGSDATEMGNDHQTISAPTDVEADALASPQVFKGHRNCETVKGVNFLGPKCEYVVSGSDCGRIFIWRKKDGELIRVMEADKHVVNCIESHPHTMVLASSGIESDIKLWTPKAIERATLPTNIEKVLIPGRIRFLPIGEYENNDEDDDEYLYYDIVGSHDNSEDCSDDYEEEEEEDEDEENSVGNNDDDVDCESEDIEDEDVEDEEFYDSIISESDGSFDDINDNEDEDFGDSDNDDNGGGGGGGGVDDE